MLVVNKKKYEKTNVCIVDGSTNNDDQTPKYIHQAHEKCLSNIVVVLCYSWINRLLACLNSYCCTFAALRAFRYLQKLNATKIKLGKK